MPDQEGWYEIATEGMPSYGQEVNAFPVGWTNDGVGTKRVYNDGKGGTTFEGNDKITHWKPLPNPPAGWRHDKFNGAIKSE